MVRISGLLIKTIRNWISPNEGDYVSLKGDITATSLISGKFILIDKDSLITVTGSDEEECKVYITYDGDKMMLNRNNYVYFNYYFEPPHKLKKGTQLSSFFIINLLISD